MILKWTSSAATTRRSFIILSAGRRGGTLKYSKTSMLLVSLSGDISNVYITIAQFI